MIYENNLAAWKERYGAGAAEQIEKLAKKEKEQQASLTQAEDGREVIEIALQDRKWHLNSMYRPEMAAKIYAARYDNAKSFWVFFAFGISDGRHVRELLKNLDKTNKLFVYEPDEEILALCMENFPLDDLIRDERIHICTGNIMSVGLKVGGVIDYCNRELIEFCILPGYDVLYHELCEQFIDTMIQVVQKEYVHKNTYEHFNRTYPYNILFNVKNMLFHNNIFQIRQRLEEYDLTGVPAIIVAAGPSLDKNIHELKRAEGKAFIIVVDAAIKRVLREGIRPDLVITEDAMVPDRFFEAEGMEDVFWMATGVTKPDVMKRYGEKVFYYGKTFKYWDRKLIETLGYRYPDVMTGGSVANTAYGVAIFFGFETIILIGQDLAFTGGKAHTSGIHAGEEENDSYIKSRSVTTVEGIDGEILETDAQMRWYKQWYEDEFRYRKEYLNKIIDATEGGAKIEGTVIQPLAQTIDEECKKDFCMWELEKDIPVPFTKEQQESLLKYLYGIREVAEKLRHNIERAIKSCNKLKELDQDSGKDEERKKRLKKIIKENDRLEQNDLLELVSYYAKSEEFELEEHIYKDEEIKPEDLADRAIRLYQGYLKGIDMLEEDIAELYK